MKFYTTDKPSDIGRVYASDGELVATVHQTKDKRIQENARLFAASPDLLAALKDAVDQIERQPRWDDDYPGRYSRKFVLSMLEAAIAKAEVAK